MNSFSVPHFQEAMKQCDEQNEKIIESQKTIIELQAKVIQNKEEEVANLKNTVREELKTVRKPFNLRLKLTRQFCRRPAHLPYLRRKF